MKQSTPIPLGTSHDNEIILYQPDTTTKLEVRLENETVWLNRQQIATLFDMGGKTKRAKLSEPKMLGSLGVSVIYAPFG